MMKVELVYNKGFKWHSKDGVHVKGYFYVRGRHVEPLEAAGIFCEIVDEKDFIEKLNILNGCFSIVIEKEDRVYAAVDRTRSFPLFYSSAEKFSIISDTAELIVKKTGLRQINREGQMDYLHSGCVFYNETLIEKLFQISAMHFINCDIKTGNIELKRYHSLFMDRYIVYERNRAETILDEVFQKASERLVKSLNGRTAVVALSGGVDSRACLMMLKMMDYKDVVCFTYGWKNSSEIKPAGQVAKHMGYPHRVIYDKRREWMKTYDDKESLDYIRYAGNLCSIAHMQELYVLRRLLDENLIPEDSIIITGHIGVIARSYYDENIIYTKEEVNYNIWQYYMKLYSMKGKRKAHYEKRFEDYYKEAGDLKGEEAEFVYENAGYDNVRSKHIVNSHRLYEFYGLEWRMPLMDREIMDTFSSFSPIVRDREKGFFTRYVMRRTGSDISPAASEKNYISKAIRNLRNPMYGIITPVRFLLSGCRKCLLPPFPVRQYRFIRRFYSYCALQELKLIKGWISEM